MQRRDPEGGERGALPVFEDSRGVLTLAELDQVPFQPERIYVLHGIPAGARRGGHGHRSQHRFLALAAGGARVVWDDGGRVSTFELCAGESLHVPPLVWYELEALDDEVIVLVVASGRYDPEDYVRDRDELALISASHT